MEEMRMKKLNLAQAKSKFKTKEDILSYFVLVENYEKHLDSKQKDDFLKPDTIDNMINILNEKQLSHLKSLIIVTHNTYAKRLKDLYGDCSKGEGISDWFKENIDNYAKQLKNDQHLIGDIRDVCKILVNKIKDIENKRLKIKNHSKNIITNYKSNLKKFGGNSIEYRQWLALMSYDHGIPDIEKTYDVTKLLRRLDIRYLKNLKSSFKDIECTATSTILNIKNLEPYLYNLATSKIKNKDYKEHFDIFCAISDDNDKFNEFNAFKRAIKDLVSKIEDVIKEKGDYIDKKIDYLKISPKFYEDVIEILRYTGDELYLKDVISEYSKPMASGSSFNAYLRKAKFLKIISNKTASSSNIESFRNKILKVRKYFLDHLTNKKYTVYRGVEIDGLNALLSTANPKLLSLTMKNTSNDLIFKEINEKKPIVFDEGFVSTSLNKGIAAHEFGGKKWGGVFFEIEIPAGSKALVLDYESIINVPHEEEILLAERTKIKINSIGEVDNHFEVKATVVK